MFNFDLILAFVFGTIIGSFLNVVIYRYNTGWSLGGRSRCLSCRKILRWFELLPVASFFFQRGRCRRCQSKISWQYPLVELITGGLSLFIWSMSIPFALKIIYFLAASFLVVIFVYDWRHHIIPDLLVFSLMALGLLATINRAWGPIAFDWWEFVFTLAAALGLASFFWLLWLISRGRWLGFADGKLALAVGLLAGPSGGLSAIALAFWSGAVVGVCLMLSSRLSRGRHSYTMKSELPFAPFIILGLALNLLFGLNVIF